MATPWAVTAMKYWPGVPTFAPSGLRTHICQVPSSAAAPKAAKATQKWARQSRSTLRTGNPPLGIGLELVLRQHLDGGPHLAVPEPTIFVARHQQITRPSKLGVNLRDVARHDHGVHIRASDEKAVNDVGRGEAQRHGTALWH